MMAMNLFAAVGAAAILSGCMVEEEPELAAEAQSRLSAELAGYVQDGPAVNCVSSRDLGGNRSVGEDTIIFSGSSGRIWVNHPAAGCPNLGAGNALRFRGTSTRLCVNDIVTVFDPATGFEYGGCGLGEFTPYRRQR